MIQRIQTVWLLVAAVFMAGLFYFPFYKFPASEPLTVGKNYLAIVLTGVSVILSIVAIFDFKNQKNQIKLCWLNVLCSVLLLVWLFYSVHRQEAAMTQPNSGGYYWIGAFLPLICIIFLFMARRGIKKDIHLVKSMDRLRD